MAPWGVGEACGPGEGLGTRAVSSSAVLTRRGRGQLRVRGVPGLVGDVQVRFLRSCLRGGVGLPGEEKNTRLPPGWWVWVGGSQAEQCGWVAAGAVGGVCGWRHIWERPQGLPAVHVDEPCTSFVHLFLNLVFLFPCFYLLVSHIEEHYCRLYLVHHW